jgi:hypothetical protein
MTTMTGNASGRHTCVEYDALPALVPRSVFLEWTGLGRRELSRLVAAGRIAVWQPKRSMRHKYLKTEIGRLMGWHDAPVAPSRVSGGTYLGPISSIKVQQGPSRTRPA